MVRGVTFEVEEAGCPSCAARVRAALATTAEVEEIAIDEKLDRATVRAAGAPSEQDVAAALGRASDGSGHRYRVRPGSWRSG